MKRQLKLSSTIMKRDSPSRANIARVEWNKEKKNLVEKIVSLKSENQNIVLELRNIKTENATHISSNQKLIAKCNTLSADLEALKRKHSDFISKTNETEKQLSDLVHEKKLLLARINQLETGIEQQHQQTTNKKPLAPANDVYEVEKIIAQKKINGVMHYKIHWKGYNKTHDSWEKETNLKCPRIINAFKKSIKKK